MLSLGMIVHDEWLNVKALLRLSRECFDAVVLVVDSMDDAVIDRFREIADSEDCILIRSAESEDKRRNLCLESSPTEWMLLIDSDEYVQKHRLFALRNSSALRSEENGAVRLPVYSYIGRGRWAVNAIHRVVRCGCGVRYAGRSLHPGVTSSLKAVGLRSSLDFSIPVHHLGDLLSGDRLGKRRSRAQVVAAELERRVDDDFLRSVLALEYIASGEFEAAFEQLRRVSDRGGDDHMPRYIGALVSMRLGGLESAFMLFSELIAERAYEREATMFCGSIRYLQGDLATAVQYFEGLLDKNPADASAMLNLSFCLRNNDGYRAASLARQCATLIPLIHCPGAYAPHPSHSIYTFQDIVVPGYNNYYSLLAESSRQSYGLPGASEYRADEIEMLTTKLPNTYTGFVEYLESCGPSAEQLVD